MPPRVFFFLSFLFLFWGRERERTAESILQSTAISTQIFQQYSYLLLPAKALLLNLVTHSTPCNFSDVLWCLYCIPQFYYMARACKYITRAVIGQYSGPDFPVMPTGIMSDVNARLVKWKYRKCKSTFDSNSWDDLKLNEKRQFLWKFLLFLVRYPRGYFPKIWVAVCSALLETLTLVQTKICDFPYSISDLT